MIALIRFDDNLTERSATPFEVKDERKFRQVLSQLEKQGVIGRVSEITDKYAIDHTKRGRTKKRPAVVTLLFRSRIQPTTRLEADCSTSNSRGPSSG